MGQTGTCMHCLTVSWGSHWTTPLPIWLNMKRCTKKLDQTYPNILGEFWQFTNVTKKSILGYLIIINDSYPYKYQPSSTSWERSEVVIFCPYQLWTINSTNWRLHLPIILPSAVLVKSCLNPISIGDIMLNPTVLRLSRAILSMLESWIAIPVISCYPPVNKL